MKRMKQEEVFENSLLPPSRLAFPQKRRYKDLISKPALHSSLFTPPFFSFICISICLLCIFQTTSKPELWCFFCAFLSFLAFRNAGLWWKERLKGEMSEEGKHFEWLRGRRGVLQYIVHHKQYKVLYSARIKRPINRSWVHEEPQEKLVCDARHFLCVCVQICRCVLWLCPRLVMQKHQLQQLFLSIFYLLELGCV